MERSAGNTWLYLWIISALGSSILCVEQITNPRIIEHPENKYVAKMQPATLNCMATGEPPPEITWYRNGEPVETSSMNPSSNHILLPSGQLFFLKVIHKKNYKPDVGTYYCKATNPETRVSVISRNATLEIAVLRDDFRVNPRNTEVAVGDSATLECRPPRGSPEPTIKWKKGGHTIETDGRLKVQQEGSLIIQDARKHDSGTYMCIAQNIAGEKESIPARLYVREKPTFVMLPQEREVEESQSVQFQCQAVGDPTPTIVWEKEEGQMPQGRSKILPDRSLKIERVKISDDGIYICRAENSVGFVEALVKLTVRSHPSFTVTPKDKIVGVGRRVTFRCEVTGNPPPAVFWSKDNNEDLMFPNQDHGRLSVTEAGTLVIEPVHTSDAGDYICQAISVAGNAYSKARLQVRDVDPRPPPIIHQGPQNQTLPIDSVAKMVCFCSGRPKPVIRWYKNRQLLRMFDPRITVHSGSLQISGLRLSDTALYSCEASSETGKTSWSAALTVEAPTNPAVIFHRTPEPSTFSGPPSRPEIRDITDTSMTLSWKANTNHGASPVFAYTVEYFSHETGEGWIVATDSITDQRYRVRNLRPDTVYMFLVRAQNTHGLSLPSQVSAPLRTTGGMGTRPTVTPYDLQLVAEKLSGNVVHMKQPKAISSTAVQITWEVRKALRYIEGFHIKYRELPGTDRRRASHPYTGRIEYTTVTVTDSGATLYIMTNLKRFTLYGIHIQPFYGTVEGPQSNVERVRTFEDVPTAPPQMVTATFEKNGTLQLSWQPPPVSETNGPIHGYKIFISGNESKFNREITTNASTFHLTTHHLVPDMVYRVLVLAWNKMGDGVKSSPLILGDKDGSGLMRGIVGQPWFIATLIGIIGGTLWIALCVFSVWLYRKRRAGKKVKTNGSLGGHMTDQQSRLGSYLNTPNYMQKDIANHVEALRPDVANVMGQTAEAPSKENLYNAPEIPSIPMKTFYNRGSHGVAPYATTTLINQPHDANGSAFRPIHDDQGSGESNGSIDNSRCNMAGGYLQSEYEGIDAGEQEPMLQRRFGSPNQPVLFLPPPPEHPPPSDIGTPPDSPRASYISPSGYDSNRAFRPYPRRADGYAPPRSDYSDNDRGYHHSHDNRYHPRQNSGDNNRIGNTDSINRVGSPMSNGLSPNMSHYAMQNPDPRTYSPRAVSEPERGPTPPVRAYKLVPIRDNHQAYSDTDGAPVPPLRMLSGGHSPPSPAPLDPMMDCGVQSSLPSLENECVNRSDNDNSIHDPNVYRHEPIMNDTGPGYDEYRDRTRNQDCPSPVSSNGDADSNVAAWASVTDVSSGRSSGGSSSDASFLAEADFASAVAKAAELSGLTVIGSTVHDPNAGREREREKVKKSHRQRSERSKRPVSPYSTDSNYSAIVSTPHKPYPKSERKRQIQDPVRQNRRNSGQNYDYSGSTDRRSSRPSIKSKPQIPQHLADLPSYSRPNFPSPSGNTSGTGGSTLGYSRGSNQKAKGAGSPHSPGQGDGLNIRTNPLAAFDTRDTPIV